MISSVLKEESLPLSKIVLVFVIMVMTWCIVAPRLHKKEWASVRVCNGEIQNIYDKWRDCCVEGVDFEMGCWLWLVSENIILRYLENLIFYFFYLWDINLKVRFTKNWTIFPNEILCQYSVKILLWHLVSLVTSPFVDGKNRFTKTRIGGGMGAHSNERLYSVDRKS